MGSCGKVFFVSNLSFWYKYFFKKRGNTNVASEQRIKSRKIG